MRIRQNMRRVWKRTVCLFLVLTICSAIVPPEAVLALDISFPELNIEKQEVYSNEVKRAPFVQTIEENPFGDQRNLLNAVEAQTDSVPGYLINQMIDDAEGGEQLSDGLRFTLLIALQEQCDSAEEVEQVVRYAVPILLSTPETSLEGEDYQFISELFDISEDYLVHTLDGEISVQEAVETYQLFLGMGKSEEEIELIAKEGTEQQVMAQLTEAVVQQNSVAAFAASSDEDLGGRNPEQTYSAPYSPADNVKEQVNLGGGSLEYTVTDAVLPGVNGLDLVIERKYDSSRANYYSTMGAVQYPTGNGNYTTPIAYIPTDILTYAKEADGSIGSTRTSGRTSYSAFFWIAITWYMEEALVNNHTILETSTGYTFYETRFTGGARPLSGTQDIRSLYSYSQIKAYQETTPRTPEEEMWGLGTGWGFNFSHVICHDRYKTLYLSDGRQFILAKNTINGLGQYTYEDLSWSSASGTVLGQTIANQLEYADGKVEYFDSNGRLLKISDQFGNAITFLYRMVNHRLEIEITDTHGRITRIYNVETETGFEKVVALPDGETVTYEHTNHTGRKVFAGSETYPGENNEYLLTAVIDQADRKTYYAYEDRQGVHNFVATYYPKSSGGYYEAPGWGYQGNYKVNYYAALSQVTYSTGLQSNYDYVLRRNAWYGYGVQDDAAVVGRYDEQNGVRSNEKVYSYRYQISNGNIYAAEKSIWVNDYITETDVDRNVSATYYFDNNGFCIKQEVKRNGTLKSTVTIEYDRKDNYPQPNRTSIVTKDYDISTGSARETSEYYSYDRKGNPTAYWPAKAGGNSGSSPYKVEYTYDSRYNLPLTEIYRRDANTTVEARNILSADGKTVVETQVYENGALVSKTRYSYDTAGRLVKSETFPNPAAATGNVVEYGYQTRVASPTSITYRGLVDADGRALSNVALSYSYDIYGNILTVRDGNGNTTRYAYDGVGRLTQTTNPDQTAQQIAYYLPVNQTIVTDELGYKTCYQFDQAGNLMGVYAVEGTNSMKQLLGYAYDSAGRMTKETRYNDAGNTATTLAYDYQDRVTEKKVEGPGGTLLAHETAVYYSDKTVHTTMDSDGKTITTVEYRDQYGQTTAQGMLLNGVEALDTYTCNFLGEVVSVKSARAKAEGYPETWTERYEYNANGQLTRTYDVFGNFTSTRYNGLGQAVAVTDKNSNSQGGSYAGESVYDAMGRLILSRIPLEAGASSITKYTYDGIGNLTREETTNHAPGGTETWTATEYDYNNRNSLTQARSLDQNGQLLSVVSYQYDALQRLTAMTAAGGSQRTSYSYDRYGNVLSMTDPEGMRETYRYDRQGNLISKTDRNGAVTQYTYDGLGREVSKTVTANGLQQTQLRSYTLAGNLRYMQEGSSRFDYTYQDGRLVRESGSDGTVQTYQYNVAGNRTGYTLTAAGAGQSTVSYTYDKADRLASVSYGGVREAAYTYDANGNRASLTYGNGVVTTYAYNRANLVTSMESKQGNNILTKYQYTYFLDGNQRTKTDQDGRVTTYAYDGLGRLTREGQRQGSNTKYEYSYAYDSAGNRASCISSGPEAYQITYAYDRNNRLLTETKVQGNETRQTSCHYDPNGNTLSMVPSVLLSASGGAGSSVAARPGLDEAVLYRYDGFNRQVWTKTGDTEAEYAYRPDGLRSGKTVDGVTTAHVWDGGNLALDLERGGTRRYLRGIGLIAMDGSGVRSYYQFNAHGDVTALAGTSGSVTRRYDYDAFGNELEVAGNPSGTDANPFRYCGEYWDNETETYYLRARYYDPSIGRFLSEDTYWGSANMIYGDDPITWNEREDDPLGLNTYTLVPNINAIMQSGNLYAYCLNNPLKYKDPSGHIAIVDDAVIVLILAGGAAYTASAAWLNSKEGQRAVQNTVVVMIDGVSYMGNALGFVINDVISWGQGASISSAKGSKQSGKEKANDRPDWSKHYPKQPDESGKDYADRVMNEKYGAGNYKKGPGSEHNKLKKWGDRGGK